MTSTSSFTEKSGGSKAPFLPLFRFTLRQNWTMLLLFAIILFFVLPVPVMMVCSDQHGYLNPDVNDPDSIVRSLNFASTFVEWGEIMRYLLVPGMSVLAVIMSCVMFKYLKNKVSVDYFHSLPVTRGRLYINQLIVGYILLLVPFLVMLLATVLVMAFNGVFGIDADITSQIFGKLGYMLQDTILYMTLFYGLGTLIGMVSGLTAVHLTLACAAVFILPLIYAVSFWFLDIFNENMWLGWYLNRNVMTFLSPAMRFVMQEGAALSVPECFLYILTSAGLFVGGYFLYTHRKSERAGMSVVYTPLGGVIRYLLIFPGTLCGGLLFYLIMDDFFWTIFGMACGCLLTSMITNTILHKTAKAMFKGWKGLCIYAGVIAVFMAAMMTNLFGVNDYVPSPGMTSKVEVVFEDNTTLFTFDGQEEIQALYEICTADDPVLADDYVYRYTYYNSIDVSVVFYPKVGLPIAKSVTIRDPGALKEQFDVLYSSDSFKEQYMEMLDAFGDIYSEKKFMLSIDMLKLGVDKDGVVFGSSSSLDDCTPDEHNEGLLNAIKADMADMDSNYFSRQTIGFVRLDYTEQINPILDSYYTYVPIFSHMKNTSDYMMEHGFITTPLEHYIDLFASCVTKVTVSKASTEAEGLAAQKTFTSQKDLGAIVSSIACFSDGYSFDCNLTLSENEYLVEVEYSYVNNYSQYAASTSKNPSDFMTHRSNCTVFLLGQIPQCVLDAFE